MQIKEKEKRKMDVILKDGSLGEQSFEDRDGARTSVIRLLTYWRRP